MPIAKRSAPLISRMYKKENVWRQILPYLTLADIHKFIKSHRTLKRIAYEYLEKGHALVVDQQTLWQYPVDNNRKFYSHFGSMTTNVEFRGLLGYDLENLFPLFPNIAHLTLRSVQMGTNDKWINYPRSIHKLVLIDCTRGSSLTSWIEKISDLEALHLQGMRSVGLYRFPSCPLLD